MNSYQIAFTVAYMLAMAGMYFNGDERDWWAGICVAMQTILVWWQIDNLLGIALIYVLAGATFVAFSVKQSGVALGILSALMAMLTVIAFYGLIPHEKGQGMAFNYYHWCTVLAWGQVGVLGWMGYVGSNFRSPLV